MSTTGSTLSKAQNYVRVLSSSGATSLSVSDSTTHSKLDTIDSTLSGTLAVSDGTSQTTLSQINDKLPALGQALKASSVPVAIASNQDTLNVSDSTAQSTLTTINGKIPALGQANMTGSLPVVLASNQSTVNVQDTSSQSELSAIKTAVQGTLTVSDSTAQTTLSAIDTKLAGTLTVSSSNPLAVARAAGNCFVAVGERDTYIEGNGNILYLRNPPGSGKTYYVYGARFSQRGAGGSEGQIILTMKTGSTSTGGSSALPYSNMKITSTSTQSSNVAIVGKGSVSGTNTINTSSILVMPVSTSIYGEAIPELLELGEDTALEIGVSAYAFSIHCRVTIKWFEVDN